MLRATQPGKKGLWPHTPSTCAGARNQLFMLLIVPLRATYNLDGNTVQLEGKSCLGYLYSQRLLLGHINAWTFHFLVF